MIPRKHMNPEQHADHLLDRLGLRHPCDLDLLIFFIRHPRTLLASEQLAAFMGYALSQIAESLEALLDKGFLTRTPNSRHAARMYVLAMGGPHGELVHSFAQVMSTREGRRTMQRMLSQRSAGGANGSLRPMEANASSAPHGRPVLVRSTETIDGAKRSRGSGGA